MHSPPEGRMPVRFRLGAHFHWTNHANALLFWRIQYQLHREGKIERIITNMNTYEINLGTFGDYIKEDWMKPLNLSADKLA